MKRIYFRTRGGGKQGWGNVIKLSNILELIKKKVKHLFIIEGNSHIHQYLKKKNINCLKLPENISLKKEEEKIKNLIKSDVTIMEMLDCSYKRQEIYKKKTKKLIVLDDILENKYCADLVICAQKKSLIKKINNLKIDFDYYPIDYKFKKYLKKNKKINYKLKKIFICLGGSFYKRTFLYLFNYFKNTDFQIIFFLGNESKKITKINLQKFKNIKVKYNLDHIAKHIYYSDLVICGGGYIKLETAFLQTPMITIPVQDHQLTLVKDFKKFCDIPYIIDKKDKNKFKLNTLIDEFNYGRRLQIKANLKKKFKPKNINKRLINLILNSK